MSVINKMLKDLDERQPQQSQDRHVVIANQQSSSLKPIFITAIISLILAGLAFAVWYFYIENQALQAQVSNKSVTTEITQNIGTADNSKTSDSRSESLTPTAKETAMIAPDIKETVVNKVSNVLENKQALAELDEVSVKTDINASQGKQANSSGSLEPNLEDAETVRQEQNTIPQKQNNQSITADNDSDLQPKVETKEEPQVLNISRKKLSAKELAAQKMQQAERAVAQGQLSEAESLFEEILLLVPSHSVARKQLAALWFGRKAYQPALNLLQQGIVLDNKDSDFRMMKARVYLTLNQLENAYKVLSALPNTNDIEYQSLLANAAQQTGNHQAAAQAYTTLVQLAPQNGKYWLGLAIAHDSSSQFEQAIDAYQTAIIQGGLSKSALNFAKQRKQELGE